MAAGQNPGEPAKVSFFDPIPSSALGAGLPYIMLGSHQVIVRVDDSFGNAVGAGVSVEMRSLQPDIGDIATSKNSVANGAYVTAMTDDAGQATFLAVVTNGRREEIFEMEALIQLSNGQFSTDKGKLRVGRAPDILRVFYKEPTAANGAGDWRSDYEAVTSIEGISGGDWLPVWIQAVSTAGDTVLTDKEAWVCVAALGEGLKVSLTPDGSAAAGSVVGALTDGRMQVWVMASSGGLSDGGLSPSAVLTPDCGGIPDNSIGGAARSGISFVVPMAFIENGWVMSAGNGHGRPDRVEILFYYEDGSSNNFTNGGWALPDSVTLRWPDRDSPPITANASAILIVGDRRLRVGFPSVSFPSGRTGSPSGGGYDLVSIWGGHTGQVIGGIPLRDSIGLIIADAADGVAGKVGPLVKEVTESALNDTLTIHLSEHDGGDASRWLGSSILVAKGSSGSPPQNGDMATGGTEVQVAGAAAVTNGYRLVLATVGAVTAGDWIRINPASNIKDLNGNAVSAGNRWVQVGLDDAVSILTPDRVIPQVKPDEGAAVVMPISTMGFKFTAGPNPVSKSTGSVGFFVNAPMSKCSGTLTVYDAVGNVVRKINIAYVGATVPGRSFAAWDLRDAKGRAVPSGTYLVRGAITVNGKRELVSAVVGVR